MILVLEFAGTWMQRCRRRCKNIHVRTPLVFVIRSYSDKTFYFATCDSGDSPLSHVAKWTLQYGCYCHALTCRVSNWCLSLYLHTLLVTTTRSWKKLSESWNIGQDSENPVIMKLELSAVDRPLYLDTSTAYALLIKVMILMESLRHCATDL